MESDDGTREEEIREELVTRHDYWRAAYATMLADLPLEHIAEFFARNPMRMGGRNYEAGDLIEHFWKERGSITMDWNYAAVNALEPFLVGKGHDALRFVKQLLHRNNRTSYMPGRILLSWFYPVMDKFFDTYDPREMIFKLIHIYTEAYLPKHYHARIKKEIEGDWIHSYIWYLSDTTFQQVRELNFDYIAGPQIQAFPRMLNFPEFEGITYLADSRRLEDVLWEGTVAREPDAITLEGEVLARPSRFLAFADSHGLEVRKQSAPDWPIWVAERDVHCPKRKRIVIYKGCAYEAPGYISVVKHRKIPNRERKMLEHLIQDAALEGDQFGPEISQRHEALRARLKRTLAFAYYPADESISVNGVHLTRGVSAKILRNIISGFVRDGRREFAYRDFKRDFEISAGQKNSNFEVRFYRLMKKLEEAAPAISIEKSGRGRFRLEARADLEFREATGPATV